MQADGPVDIGEGFPRQPDITEIVLDQKNLDGPIFYSDGIHDFCLSPAGANRKFHPCAGRDSSTMPSRPSFAAKLCFCPPFLEAEPSPAHPPCACCGSLTFVSQKPLMLF